MRKLKEEKGHDHSASLAMFQLLQPRFNEVKFGFGGWDKSSEAVYTRLYLNILWPDGSTCSSTRDGTYFDFKEGSLRFSVNFDPFWDDKDWSDQMNQAAWKALVAARLSEAKFLVEPRFQEGVILESPSDYIQSYLKITVANGNIKGLHISKEIKAWGWQNYFPRGSESFKAREAVSLIDNMLILEDIEFRKGRKDAYSPDVIERTNREYENSRKRLGV